MGKRTKSKKPTLKVPEWKKPLSATFDCLFCNHQKTVLVTLSKKSGTGQLSCNACDQRFQSSIHYLSLPVDVYYDWVDACDAVAKATANPPGDDDEIASKGNLPAEKGRSSSGRHLEVAVDGEDGDQGDSDKV